MKTFTTYAEKKAKQFLNLLQGYTKGIRITAILMLLLMGVNSAWAGPSFSGGYVYFHNKGGWNDSYKYLCIGKSNYTELRSMSVVTNTQLWRNSLPTSGWGDATYMAVIGTSGSWNSGNWGTSNLTNATHRTKSVSLGNWEFKSGHYQMLTPASGSNDATLELTWVGDDISSMNKTITVKAKVSTDGGSTYAEATSPGTLSASSYKFTTYSSCASATSLSSGTITCGYTANTTLTAADATGYTFVGWYDSAGTEQTTEKTLSINPTADATYYAYYKKNQHTVLFGVHSSGHGSLTAKVGSTSISSNSKVNYGSTIVFTATPSTGYQIEGWYSNSACTTPIDNGTNKTYTVTIKGGTNVYVKFEAIPVNSHNITYTAQGAGWTYGNSNPTTAEEGATVTFVVNPTAGYRVSVSSDGPALTGPNANNQYTFTMPTKDVKITVEAKPEQYTVTLNKQSGTGGPSSVTATYLAAMPTITPPTRTGYTFNGYFDATSGGTKYYDANGHSAKNWDKTSNTTLYAQWTANKYTVKFNANGGKGSMSDQSHTYGVSKALTANAFTRTGYTFEGWNTNADGTGTSYTDKQSVSNLSSTDGATVNLYAVWQALPPTPVILKPNDQWKQANARYAIYYWGDGTDNIGWVEMTDLGCSGEYFTAEVPASYLDFKFVRLDPKGKGDASKNDGLHWDYKWNETNNLTAPAADKNLYDMTLKTHLYLDPGVWNVDNAWFAAYFFGNGETWKKMTDVDGLFACEIPTNYPNVIFVRKNPSNQDLNFNDKWAQTGDLTIPTDGKNKFSISGWDNNGSWSAIDDNIHDNSKWTSYTVPTYTININAPEAGSIAVTVGDNTTTVTDTPKQITNIAAGSTFSVAYTPNAGFELGHSEVEGIKEAYNGADTYTVCGPVDITAHFVTKEEQVVYLRPNGTWLSDSALFYAYAFNRYGDDEWIELTTKKTDYTGAFSGTIPAGYSDVIFVRINPTAADPSWNDNVKWNQSVDYVIPVNTTTNRFIIGEKITAEGADKDKYQGSWEASNKPIYGIPGDWQNDWKADEYPLMGPDGEVTVNIKQTNDTLGFKVYQYPYGSDNNSAQWLGNYGTMVRGGEGVHEGGWTMETSTSNCGLGVDVAGDYVFHFNIRESKLTVQYPPMPVPSTITLSAQRIFEDAPLNWIAGNGTEATPYQLYVDETARITITGLDDVPGLTTCYRVGDNEEQTSNIIDFTKFSTTATSYTVSAYYKNAAGATSDTVTVQTPYIKGLPMPFYLMTSPSQEINVDRIAAGENITVQFRSDAAATVGLYLQINDEDEIELPADITNSISKDYTHDVDDNIEPCILHYIARSAATVHGRTFEAKADVAIYKNVIIKVHDPEGWVKNAYMWRDYSDAVKTQWPGEPVLQNFGTWRVFSVKYPYYDRFIVNEGLQEGGKQTLDWILPADDTCYELLDPADNGSDKEEDKTKYGLKVADCPENLLVEDIKDTTIMEGEQIVVMPKIHVGLGYQVADIEASVYYDNTRSIKAMMSGTNVTILGNAEGESKVTVTYILDNVRIEKTFKVTVTKRTKITIQVKVPTEHGPEADRIGWWENDKIYVRYWNAQNGGTDQKMNYLTQTDYHYYFEATIPLDDTGKTNFNIFYDNRNEDWRYSTNATDVTEDGCYLVYNDGSGDRGLRYEGVRCLTDQYQVRIAMGSGKTFTSNIVTAEEDTLSFFAPGMNETGYKAGVIMLYQNDKMIATIEPSTFAKSDVYTATLNDALNGLDNVSTYSGNFYIRTYGTSHANIGFNNGKGWNSIKDLTAVEKDSVKFTKFASREGEFYNHYWVQAMNTGTFDGKDVSACVANEYNDDLAGKLLQDKHTNEYGDIKVGKGKVINVRFGYDPRTNYFGRAILQGSERDNYLNIHCDNAYRDKDCTKKFPYGTSDRDNKMYDISTWVYQRDIYVPIDNSHPSASLYLEATSPSTERTVTDHLLGYVKNDVTGEDTSTPIQKQVIGSGTTNGIYLIRVVYDFKTNRLIAAWLPQGTVDVKEDRTLHADVLFVRKENDTVPQVQLAENGKIRSLETMYFALELERGGIDPKDPNDPAHPNNRHEEQYLFTLPFNSLVGSISGVPGYMQTWGIQRYRGDLRAKHGLYLETPTYWQWLSTTDTLYAGEGYLLVFDKKAAPFEEIEVDKMDSEGNIIDGQKEKISMMRLYFASDVIGFDMQPQSELQRKDTFPDHTCTLTLHDRYKYDSNWKVIGTNSYSNAGAKSAEKDNEDYVDKDPTDGREGFPKFRYLYKPEMSNDNKTFTYSYVPEDGEKSIYNSFFAYMVQFAGIIEWEPVMSETVPEGIAARRYVAEGERTSYTTRLELANATGEKQDQTFVALDKTGTTGFDQNKDLNKVINLGANIYTLSEDVPYAGNTLAMEKQTVPVGIVVAEAGEYTFRMPDGTDGISVTLVDNVTGTHTNMLMDEYTITLDAGTIENRFYLVVDPDRTATSVENVGEEAKGEEAKGQIKKFLIDGKLFIRTADGIFDAKGQRL